MAITDEIFHGFDSDIPQISKQCFTQQTPTDSTYSVYLHAAAVKSPTTMSSSSLWQTYKAADGKPYWFNTQTKQSVWEVSKGTIRYSVDIVLSFVCT